MPSAVSPNPRAGAAQPDELDRLLDYDAAVEDFLNDIPVRGNEQNAATEEQPRDEDQEVQVKKKRQPIPKLDENRLLSEAGIPKLRKITKSRLKFRGKGHEFSDISRLLNTYQLWLDDLYPRAKFRDALTMVEKVGHSKRMQVTRRAWLDGTKPNRRLSPEPEPEQDLDFDVMMSGANGNANDSERQNSMPGEDAAGENATEQASRGKHDGDAPDDDELDALLAESGPASAPAATQRKAGPFEDDSDDELDALLSENHPVQPGAENAKTASISKASAFEAGPDEDELDALMNEQGPTHAPDAAASAAGSTRPQTLDDFADDEEAMASMGW
ncbi:Chromosome segregation in meiosis protein 3 [Pseudocercospora fuligena]|uniref:Chromosome segregation in meiosis protein n=1 Tax=Pseudocercospora fuligena TaxID=685502 RepID=A0A8H6RBB7_9PEZI|nr:Chromosome segregation in meiosis protein 3 [Pseudocercospora fuligena]